MSDMSDNISLVDGLPGLRGRTVANYRDIANVIEVEGDKPGTSPLAGALLKVPGAFHLDTVEAIIEQVRIQHDPDTNSAIAANETTYSAAAAELFNAMQDKLDESDDPEAPAGAEEWETIITLLEEDEVESAAQVYRENQEVLTDPGYTDIQRVVLLKQVLESSSKHDITPEILALAQYNPDRVLIEERFPSAFGALREIAERRTALEERKARRKETQQRVKDYSLAERGFGAGSQLHHVEAMMAAGEGAEAIAAVAVSHPGTPEDLLLEALEDASVETPARWLAGLENSGPKPGQVAKLAERLDVDTLRAIGARMNELASEGHDLSVPWLTDVVQHVYVPSVDVAPQLAVLVFHELNKECQDDPAMWAALVAATTDEENPFRLQDLEEI